MMMLSLATAPHHLPPISNTNPVNVTELVRKGSVKNTTHPYIEDSFTKTTPSTPPADRLSKNRTGITFTFTGSNHYMHTPGIVLDREATAIVTSTTDEAIRNALKLMDIAHYLTDAIDRLPSDLKPKTLLKKLEAQAMAKATQAHPDIMEKMQPKTALLYRGKPGIEAPEVPVSLGLHTALEPITWLDRPSAEARLQAAIVYDNAWHQAVTTLSGKQGILNTANPFNATPAGQQTIVPSERAWNMVQPEQVAAFKQMLLSDFPSLGVLDFMETKPVV